LTVSLLALLTMATTVGCGRTALPTTVGATKAVASLPTVMASGIKRKLGYNVTRYKRVVAPKSNPQHLTFRGTLPGSVDQRAQQAPVYDQGDLGSCTAFSMGKGMREYMQRKNGEKLVPLSALWLYYEERVLMGTVNEDSGANMIDGINVLRDQGNAVETAWPYATAQFKVKAPAAAYEGAAAHKIASATELAELADIKVALANGQPVVFGFMVYSSFQRIGKNGVMPMPKPNESILGGHAVHAVGYDDAKQALIVRNSWGKGWGDQGYFYMPYTFAADKEKAMEWWTAE